MNNYRITKWCKPGEELKFATDQLDKDGIEWRITYRMATLDHKRVKQCAVLRKGFAPTHRKD